MQYDLKRFHNVRMHARLHYDKHPITSFILQTIFKVGIENVIMRQKVIIAKNR